MKNKFYSELNINYDKIFPININQVSFIRNLFLNKSSKLVEIGCATGQLQNALKEYDILGTDLEQSFIDIASENYPKSKFKTLNMVDIKSLNETFDGIICVGNTLVHINNEAVAKFISNSFEMLNIGGKIVIQILNYDNILKNQIDKLPLIENEFIKFERLYQFGRKLLFNTQLTIKSDNQILQNSIQLYPISKFLLEDLLKSAGFEQIKFYGSFKMDSLKENSLPLIVEATKK